MSLHRYLLTGALLAMSVCQAQSGGMREGTTATPKRRLQPWLVGLAAVAGFLFLVFIVLIVKRLVYGRDEDEDSKGYDNKDAESVSSVDEDDTKQTVL